MTSRFHALLALMASPAWAAPAAVQWEAEGPRATFTWTADTLATSGLGNSPNWLHSRQEYADLKLSFEYNLAQWAEAAVYLRAPRGGRPGEAGLAIVLAHDFHKQVTPYVTGALRGLRAPKKAAVPAESWGAWHKVEILLRGERLEVDIDGERVQEVANMDTDPELRLRLKRGFVGFPDLGHAYRVRAIKLEDLGAGREPVALSGWKLRDGTAGQWRFAADGTIKGASGHGILYAANKFADDFEFTAMVRSRNHVNGGVFLRGSPDGAKPRGFEIQIYSPTEAVYPTGSIYGIARSRSRVELEDRWFLLQVRVEGTRCLVRVDGETVAESDAAPVTGEAQIGLQIHMENASIEFRDLRARRLHP